MAENSKIGWCHHTANFWIGCHEVSPECDFCYARELSNRYGWAEWGLKTPRHETKMSLGKLQSWDRKAQKAGERHRVFVNSLSDIADAFAPQELRDRVVMWAGETPNLDYLLLTKRPQNYNHLLPLLTLNMWGGTTVGVKKSLSRIKHLQDTAFRIKFLSIEPLIEDLGEIDLAGINWVIIGCESGAKRRRMQTEWAIDIVNQCDAAGVPVFVKQMEVDGKVCHEIDGFPSSLQRQEFPQIV